MRQLKAVLEIARLKSFTRAAEYLHISQQGLSLMIQEVETQLDCRLFDRTTRTVNLTPAAYQFLPVAEQAVRSLESAGAAIGKMSERARLTLTVAATPQSAATLLPEACALFRKKHPDILVNIIDAPRIEIPDIVESGAADVGFGVFFKPTAGFERTMIFRCELVCMSNTANTTSRKPMRMRLAPDMNWDDLQSLPLLGLPADNPLQQLVDTHLKTIGRENERRQTFNTLQTVLAMAEAGFGVAILPSFLVAAARNMNLDIARLIDPVVPVNFFQINQRGRSRAPSEESFTEALIQTMRRRCDLANA